MKSKAFRPAEDPSVEASQITQDASTGQGPDPSVKDEARLTNDEITAGVDEARAAANAPSLDLLAFEEALKKKHDEFAAAGITPQLYTPKGQSGKSGETQVPKNKYKVPI